MPTRNVQDATVRRMFIMGGWGFSALAVALGSAILFQDDTRMQARGWTVALSFGGNGFWGAWLLLFGALMAISMTIGHHGSQLMMAASVAVAFALFGRFMASLEAIADPATSLTGPPVWFALTCVYLAQGIVHSRAFAAQ